MENQLVTIKTFDNSPEAHLAKNRLEDAGLQVRLTGEDTVSMNWMLSNALGGIQLLVKPDDLEQAQELLAAANASARANKLEPGNHDEANQVGSPTDDLWGPDSEDPEDVEPVANDREQNADRAFRGAVMGILFFPLQLYVFWLLLRIFISDDELRGQHRSRAWWAAAINVPYMLGMCILLRGM